MTMIKNFCIITAAVFLLAGCENNVSLQDNSPVAICQNGKFVGYVESNGVFVFKGIPYAKAPVGKLRWKTPQEVEASDETFEAKKFKPAAIQSYDEGEISSHGEMSEDCLNLNVWTADMTYREGRPVMVWIHGGSYGWGGVMDPLYDGKYLPGTYRDVVLVTIAYRVNALGFIDFKNVPGGEDFPDTPYLGILDQIQALKWIQKNIKAFGGDPGNVTIFGESAGGGSVSSLLVARNRDTHESLTKGLFRRAIAMSGSIGLERSQEEYDSDAIDMTTKFLAATGCSTMDQLMALSGKEILDALNSDIGEVSIEGISSRVGDFCNYPLRDDIYSILPLDGFEALRDGASADVDLMVGTVADELRYHAHLQFNPEDREEGPLGNYYEWIQARMEKAKSILTVTGCPEGADAIDECFEGLDCNYDLIDKEWDGLYPDIWNYTEISNEYTFRMPAITMAQNHTEAGGKSYMYYFAKGLDADAEPEQNFLKACHACEVTYAFNNSVTTEWGHHDPDLTLKFSNAFVNFARTGNPSIPGAVCPQYDAKNRSTLYMDRDGNVSVVNNPLGRQTELLLPTYKQYFLNRHID